MKTRFIFYLTQKNKSGEACLPLLLLLFLIFTSLFNKSSSAQCNNVGFENCDFTEWTGTYSRKIPVTNCGGLTCPTPISYRYMGLDLATFNKPANAQPYHAHAIMNSGTDVYAGFTVVDPLQNSTTYTNTCSARIGNDSAYGGGGTLQYSWVVSATNNSFTYDYAVVMADPGTLHNGVQEPYFRIRMWTYKNPGDSGPDSVLIDCASYQATPDQATGFLSSTVRSPYNDPVIYKPWSAVTIPLDNFIGKRVKIIFETRDCCPGCNVAPNAGSHFCYAYIDCSCAPLEIIPAIPPTCTGVSSKLIAPPGAASYAWTGSRILSGATTRTVSIGGPGTYTVNMTTFGQTTCTYSRTITVSTLPSGHANFSANTVCLGTTTTFTNTSTIVAGTMYTWNFGDGTPTSSSQNPTHTYSVAGTYSVDLALTSACPKDTTINVKVLANPTSTFTTQTVCVNEGSAITYTGSAPAGSTFTWNFAGGIIVSGSGQGPYVVSWPSAGTKNVSLSVNNGGCISTNTVVTVVNPIPVITASSTTICKGEQTSLTVSGAATYTWSTGATTASITASPTVTTTYTVTGVQAGIVCPGITTATITVNPLPVVTVRSATICNGQGDPGTLTASGADAYSWSTGATTASISASPTATTTYTVTGNKLGCLNTSTGTITVNPVPTVTVNPATICKGSTATLTAGSADSYLWSTGATTASITPSPTFRTEYLVTGTSLGCYQTASTTITVQLAPTVAVMPQSVCIGQTTSLFASGAMSYIWDNGSTTNPLIVTPTSTTTYTVEGAGCPNTTTVTVTVNPMPVISASSTTVCDGRQAMISAYDNLGTISTYAWSTGSDSITITESPHQTTTYTVVGSTAFGCKDTAVGTIVVEPNPVVKVSSASVCPKAAGTIMASGADSYLWSTGAITNSITASPASTTTYSVTGTTRWGCTGSSAGTITIVPPPTAGFIASPNPTSMFDTEIHFSNQSSVDVVYWHWDYGDGDTLSPNTASPIHTYTQEVAKYTVTLIVHNSTPCWDTISSDIFIGPEFAFYIPNSFTPNGDKNNNGFRGTGVGIMAYRLQIFDRWGDLVWQSTELDEYWNGKANGGSHIVQEDVYVWKVFLTDVFGREHFYIGTVTAVK